MKKRRFFLWTLPLLSLGALLLLGTLYPASRRRQPPLLELSVITREAEGWPAARQGMEQAAADLNVELRFLSPAVSNSAEEQRQLLRRETEGGAAAILLFPADRAVLEEEVRRTAAGAALVTLETDMTAQGAGGYVGTDNAALGAALGRAALNGVRPGETVLLLDSAPGDNGVRERLQAARTVLESEGRQVRLCRRTGEESLSAALEAALGEGGIQAAVAFEASALETAAQLSRLPLLYGAGSTAAVAAGLEQGSITLIAAQNEFSTGYLAVETAAGLARREPVTPAQLSFFTVRKEEMYDPDRQKLLFPVT